MNKKKIDLSRYVYSIYFRQKYKVYIRIDYARVAFIIAKYYSLTVIHII